MLMRIETFITLETLYSSVGIEDISTVPLQSNISFALMLNISCQEALVYVYFITDEFQDVRAEKSMFHIRKQSKEEQKENIIGWHPT